MRDFIICSICDSKVGRKGLPQHLKTHNVLFSKYKEDNSDQFETGNKCRVCDNPISKWSKSCSKKCSIIWRKSLTGKDSIRWGATLSAETKKKMSKSNIGNKSRVGTKHSMESKSRMSNTRKARKLGIGKLNGMYGKTHTPEAIKKIFAHKKMNKLEKKFSKLLDSIGVKYHFQYFMNKDGVCKSYDFKIKGKNIIFEIDGDFWHGNPNQTNHWKDVESVRANDIVKENMARAVGYKLYRYWETDIKNNTKSVVNDLKLILI